MSKLCRLCGSEKSEGSCPNDHSFKKMCLNCEFAVRLEEDGDLYRCTNEENLNSAKEKMLAAATKENASYTITSFDIEPVPLKRPTLKCGKWVLSEEVRGALEKLFV